MHRTQLNADHTSQRSHTQDEHGPSKKISRTRLKSEAPSHAAATNGLHHGAAGRPHALCGAAHRRPFSGPGARAGASPGVCVTMIDPGDRTGPVCGTLNQRCPTRPNLKKHNPRKINQVAARFPELRACLVPAPRFHITLGVLAVVGGDAEQKEEEEAALLATFRGAVPALWLRCVPGLLCWGLSAHACRSIEPDRFIHTHIYIDSHTYI